MLNNPIILNCLTNLERSSLIAVTITCVLALESDTPIIISKFYYANYVNEMNSNQTFYFINLVFSDVTDVWYRICSQRKNILNDMSVLQQSMQIVLQCCREFIKKSKFGFSDFFIIDNSNDLIGQSFIFCFVFENNRIAENFSKQHTDELLFY